MTATAKHLAFKALHTAQDPLVLYNIWDSGGAEALTKAGAKAIATGSWSVAAAQGYVDGEAIPLDFTLQIIERIVQSTALPVSVDFEGGYAEAPDDVAANVQRLITTGAIGLNFEDRIVGGSRLFTPEAQSARIAAIRQAAATTGAPLFINARTDLFLGSNPETHAGLIPEALARAESYAAAGADGFFIPGLTDKKLIAQVTAASALPVNIMMLGALDTPAAASGLGAARISFGPAPYLTAMDDLTARFKALPAHSMN